MQPLEADRAFAGSIPELYERFMVPLIFAPYAEDLAERVRFYQPARVLEIAAGTGALTRQLSQVLPVGTTIIATDFNQAMLSEAAALGTPRPVQWQQADAMQLPFGEGEFDLVVCQFGAMFFPDKAAAFAEARRVLRDGGAFCFSVWDRIEANDIADTVTQALAAAYPLDPPRFMARVPHGYHDLDRIRADLRDGGFDADPIIATVPIRSRAESARVAAVAYCQGSPLRGEIEARQPPSLEEATSIAEAALVARFGEGAIESGIQAHVVTALRQSGSSL